MYLYGINKNYCQIGFLIIFIQITQANKVIPFRNYFIKHLKNLKAKLIILFPETKNQFI